MKHLTPISKTPVPAASVLRAFLRTKRETIENATNLKDFF
jgi:hypothetical protein